MSHHGERIKCKNCGKLIWVLPNAIETDRVCDKCYRILNISKVKK
jgi:hypothetical protein